MQDIIYGLNDRPKPISAALAAFQHLLAMFVAIVTPPLIIGNALGLPEDMKAYIINMALFTSGLATFIQVRRFGPVGAGLLSIQGTSFTFLSLCIGIGSSVLAAGGSHEKALGTIFGVVLICAPMEVLCSRFIPMLRKVITPLVSGIVVTLIGLYLIRVGITDIGGGMWLLTNKPEEFGSAQNLCLALLVFCLVIFFNRSNKPMLRMGAVFIGLSAGLVAAYFLGLIRPMGTTALVNIPVPFKFGIYISWAHVIPMALLFLITMVESIGDMTATSAVSGEPIEGPVYMRRMSGGILADGLNSMMAAVFNSFPTTSFSQNNGVIQITGVASRTVGIYLACFLMLFGLVPFVGTLFSGIPAPVLGGATIIMFGTVAASGIRIIASSVIDRRGVMIIAISLGLGLGVMFRPEILQIFPDMVQQIFGAPITTGGLTAIFLNIILPYDLREQPADGQAYDEMKS